MNLNQLEYVIAVDRLKNFTKAAEHCNVTQATLSTMVKKLEEELGVVIFDREKKPLLTTDIGQIVLQDAKRIILESNLLREKVKSANSVVEGFLRIGIIPTVASSLLSQIVPPILSSYPKLKLQVKELTTNNIVKSLKDNSIDVGILATPINDDTLEEDILFYETLMVYGTGEGKSYVMPEDIKDEQIWLLEEGHCIRNHFMSLCKLNKKDFNSRLFAFEPGSFDTLLNMVDTFGGLTLIPEIYCRTLSAERQAKVSFFKSPIPVREVSLVYYRPQAKKRILDAIGDKIRSTIVPTLMSNNYKPDELIIAKS